MKNIISLLFFSAILVACDAQNTQKYDLAVHSVNLVDGTGNPIQKNVNLYIHAGKIVDISEKRLDGVESERLIDGNGKYIIPGLIEAHAHPSGIEVDPEARKKHNHRFKTMIHYGVTTTVLFGGSRGSYANMTALQNASKNGSMVSPRIFFSSPIVTIEGAHPMKTYPSGNWVDGETVYLLRDTSQVKSIVREAKSYNAIGIKLVVEEGPTPPFIERIDPQKIQKIVEESHNANLPVYAHISDMEEVRICMEAGVDNLVHFIGAVVDWKKDKPLIAQMGQRGVSWITTLALAKSLIYYRLNPQWLERPEITQVYDSTQIANLRYPNMEEAGKATLSAFTGSDNIPFSHFVKPMVQDIAAVKQAGVNVVLGTDVGGDAYIFAGLSMHEEMEVMQIGGIEPVQIIKMATYNAAKMLGISDEYGSLEKGKYADFIILSENPLKDITNTLTIEKVFKAGIEQPRIINDAK